MQHIFKVCVAGLAMAGTPFSTAVGAADAVPTGTTQALQAPSHGRHGSQAPCDRFR